MQLQILLLYCSRPKRILLELEKILNKPVYSKTDRLDTENLPLRQALAALSCFCPYAVSKIVKLSTISSRSSLDVEAPIFEWGSFKGSRMVFPLWHVTELSDYS